jgi:protease-4
LKTNEKVRTYIIMLTVVVLITGGCAAPKLNLFMDETEPLREYTLEGMEKGKVLVIPVEGIISDAPERKFLRPKPSMVQEIVSQLRLAEKDKEIKAVLLKINSPGGSTTASDLLYHEIMEFKNRTQAKVVVSMMNLATSGGYYIALPADHIMAHPTTVTGSIGVILLYPRVTGLMKKIGLDIEVNKSGKNKDMASPFRKITAEERRIFQGITEDLGNRFLDLVMKHRDLDTKAVENIASARVYLSKDALNLGLVDEIGYLSDALLKSKILADLPKDAKVVVYRRTKYPDDNVYNTKTSFQGIQRISLIDLDMAETLSDMHTGFYYLWMPSVY